MADVLYGDVCSVTTACEAGHSGHTVTGACRLMLVFAAKAVRCHECLFWGGQVRHLSSRLLLTHAAALSQAGAAYIVDTTTRAPYLILCFKVLPHPAQGLKKRLVLEGADVLPQCGSVNL